MTPGSRAGHWGDPRPPLPPPVSPQRVRQGTWVQGASDSPRSFVLRTTDIWGEPPPRRSGQGGPQSPQCPACREGVSRGPGEAALPSLTEPPGPADKEARVAAELGRVHRGGRPAPRRRHPVEAGRVLHLRVPRECHPVPGPGPMGRGRSARPCGRGAGCGQRGLLTGRGQSPPLPRQPRAHPAGTGQAPGVLRGRTVGRPWGQAGSGRGHGRKRA